jgi:hypothetical protein
MEDHVQMPAIEPGRGRLRYDKARRTIVAEFPAMASYKPVTVEGADIVESLEASAAYMDEKARDRFVVTAEALHGAIAEIRQLRRCCGLA